MDIGAGCEAAEVVNYAFAADPCPLGDHSLRTRSPIATAAEAPRSITSYLWSPYSTDLRAPPIDLALCSSYSWYVFTATYFIYHCITVGLIHPGRLNSRSMLTKGRFTAQLIITIIKNKPLVTTVFASLHTQDSYKSFVPHHLTNYIVVNNCLIPNRPHLV
ncbi:hypothetical protein H4Q26_015903 [Puccinia striiformis f. sp. tritici PST-130]|nr:hypothetical protein H4Q26_015903 [Puccinia striiformis f. sp. tritici PST-130]